MTDSTTLHTFEAQLAQHYIPINVLLGFFQLAALDRSRTDWRTTLDNQICACIQLLGSIREPDLIKITGVDQSTINRRVRALQKVGTIHVSTYTTSSAGKPAKWLQMPESADLDAEQRADRLALAQLIIAYRAAWAAAQTPPAAPEPEPVPEDQPPITTDELHEPVAETKTTPSAPPTEAEEAPTEPEPPADMAQPPVQAEELPEPAQPPIKRIPTPYPMPPAQPVAPAVAAQPHSSFWYRSFYLWITPLIVLGIFSFVMNERAALVAFLTQVGIPLLWLGGAIVLIGLLVEHRERVFERFYPVEHRALALACGLILAVAVVQSGLWTYAHTLWTGTPPPAAPQPIPTAIPDPVVVTETPTPEPTPTCPAHGSARVTAPRGLRLRQDASTNATVLMTIPHNTVVTILCRTATTGDGTQWVLIQHGDQQGWVAEAVPGARYLTSP